MAAQTSAPIEPDPVKQFSVFAENKVGRLYDLSSLLTAHNVHIMAVTTFDATDSTIVRCVVDDPDLTRELLINNDFFFTECDVVVVEYIEEADFRNILKALLEVEINIQYVYAFFNRPHDRTAVVLSIEDEDIASQALERRGYRVLSQRDISR